MEMEEGVDVSEPERWEMIEDKIKLGVVREI